MGALALLCTDPESVTGKNAEVLTWLQCGSPDSRFKLWRALRTLQAVGLDCSQKLEEEFGVSDTEAARAELAARTEIQAADGLEVTILSIPHTGTLLHEDIVLTIDASRNVTLQSQFRTLSDVADSAGVVNLGGLWLSLVGVGQAQLHVTYALEYSPAAFCNYLMDYCRAYILDKLSSDEAQLLAQAATAFERLGLCVVSALRNLSEK